MMIIQSSSNMGHDGSKTRLLGQICSKLSSTSRGHSFASVFINFYQIVSLGDIWIKFEHGSCLGKNYHPVSVVCGSCIVNIYVAHPLEATVLL